MSQSSLGESIQNWDPMQKDYEDPNFNTYRDGPGAHLDLEKQPCFTGKSGRKDGPLKLFVGNIPSSVDKTGIENVFRNIGKPIDIFRKQPDSNASRTWAFVTFASYREADSAIRELNNTPPLRLRIEFAKGTETDERIPIKPNKSYLAQDVKENNHQRQSLSRNSETSGKGRGLVLKPFVDPRTHDGFIGRDTGDISHFQPYGGSSYDESNVALMRGVQRANGPRGPKKFVMGRGCFDRELDEIVRPQQVKPIGAEVRASLENYVMSLNGQYEFGKREVPKAHILGTCTLCAKEATQYCQRCKDWYCSRACQETDWPRHRKYCIPPSLGNTLYEEHEGKRQSYTREPSDGYTMHNKDIAPRNEHRNISSKNETNGVINHSKAKRNTMESRKSSNYNNDKSSLVNNDDSHDFKEFQSKDKSQYKRNTTVPRHQNAKTEKTTVGSFHKKPSDYKKIDHKESRSPRKEDQSPQKEDERYDRSPEEKLERAKICVNSVNSHKTPLSAEGTEEEKSQDETYKKTEEISKTSFTKVKVEIPLGPYEFWAQIVDNVREIFKLSSTLEKCKDSAQVKPIVGAYCMAPYQGMWFRGKVTSIKPQIKVHYIDYGNEDPAEADDLRELPDVAKHFKAQAIKISLAPGTSDKYKDLKQDEILSVKLASKKNDFYIVQVEGEEYDDGGRSDESSEELAMQNVMVLLKPRMQCYLFITEYNDPEDFVASLVPRNLIDHYNSLFYGKLKEECEQRINEKFVPQLGEAVLAKFSEGWLRSYVVHISSPEKFTVASCDTGLVESVKEIKKMPRKLREIAQFAVHCRVMDNVYKAKKLLSETKKVSVIVREATCDSALGLMENEGINVCELEIRKWTAPFELYEELECVELKDGPCVVTAHMSAVDLYVRPLTVSCIETYNLILQDVAKHCFMVQPLDHTPKVGEVLAAQFTEDKTFYRAIVREVNRMKGIKVQYIDFGNIEYVQQQSLKPLSEKLRSKVCLAVKVKLNGVTESPLNEEALRYYKDLVVSEKKLSIKLNESVGNEVILLESDGTSVNDQIFKMLEPNWKKKTNADDRFFTMEDITYEHIEIGSSVDLVIHSVIDYNSFLAINENSRSFRELKSHLEYAMGDYCEQINEPYTPRERELCLAKSDGTWFRCICLFGGGVLSLLSLDTGEVLEVTHDNIRRMPKDFIQLPVCGLLCDVKTEVDCSTKELQEKIQKFLTIAKAVHALVIGQYNAASMKGYVVRIPELDDRLKEQLGQKF